MISTWSSGTGGAGVVGATSYAGLTSLGMSPKSTLLLMLVVPGVEAIAFWVILRHPHKMSYNYNKQNADAAANANDDDDRDYGEEGTPLVTMRDKLNFIPRLLMYSIPLTLVYLFEYFINQGLVRILLQGLKSTI